MVLKCKIFLRCLSFAQFEREIASERIRDKMAASKRKGIWVGGPIPLGYQTNNRKISIDEPEAEQVRMIFTKYLELGTLRLLMAYLVKRNVTTKPRMLKSGKIRGALPFTTSGLSYMLRNRFYIGEVVFNGETFKGPQEAILDRKLFSAVQFRLDKQRLGANKSLPATQLA